MYCETCKFFRVHYIKRGRSYHKILDGHCVYPRLKRRKAADLAFCNWKGLDADQNLSP